MKPAVEVSITSWKKNVVKPGQEYGRVLLMPGTGYNCDRPLLYWSAQALVEAGWRIDRMNVRNASDDLSTVIPVLNQAIDGWVAAARESGAGKAPQFCLKKSNSFSDIELSAHSVSQFSPENAEPLKNESLSYSLETPVSSERSYIADGLFDLRILSIPSA